MHVILAEVGTRVVSKPTIRSQAGARCEPVLADDRALYRVWSDRTRRNIHCLSNQYIALGDSSKLRVVRADQSSDGSPQIVGMLIQGFLDLVVGLSVAEDRSENVIRTHVWLR